MGRTPCPAFGSQAGRGLPSRSLSYHCLASSATPRSGNACRVSPGGWVAFVGDDPIPIECDGGSLTTGPTGQEGEAGREGTVDQVSGWADWVRFAHRGSRERWGGGGAELGAWSGSGNREIGGKGRTESGDRGTGADRGVSVQGWERSGGRSERSADRRDKRAWLRSVGPRRLGRVERGGC